MNAEAQPDGALLVEESSEPGWMWTLKAALPFLLFAVVAAEPFYRVWFRWIDKNDYYTHGPLVAFIAMYLVLRKRKELTGEAPPDNGALYAGGFGALVLYFIFTEYDLPMRAFFGLVWAASCGYLIHRLRRLRPEPWKPGLFVLIPALVFCVVAGVNEIVSIGWFFVQLVGIGLVLYFLGKRISLLLWFPMLFLFSSVPMPEYVVSRTTMPLKRFATANTVKILNSRLVGITCRQYGNRIVMAGDEDEPTKDLTVGAVCSGLRSLIALISFGMLFAYITPLSVPKKLILLVATIPASFIANLFRILTLSLVTHWWSSDVATKDGLWNNMELGPLSSLVPNLRKLSNEPVHDFTGILIFVVAFIGLFSLERVLTHIERRQQRRQVAQADPAAEGADE